ncbi:MAG: hypothetical protein M9929_07430 [Burkholderiaceae bacterium]|nr:hypothetical protein [Burkholderiaceae bacterium]
MHTTRRGLLQTTAAVAALGVHIPIDLISGSSVVTSQSSVHGQVRRQWADLLSSFDAPAFPSTLR